MRKRRSHEIADARDGLLAFGQEARGELPFMLHAIPDFQCDRHARIPCPFSEPCGTGEEVLIGTHLDKQRWGIRWSATIRTPRECSVRRWGRDAPAPGYSR